MSALVWLVKPVQSFGNHWGHLGGLQAGRMRWFIKDASKDLYKKGTDTVRLRSALGAV